MGMADKCNTRLEEQGYPKDSSQATIDGPDHLLESVPRMCIRVDVSGVASSKIMDSADLESGSVAISSKEMSWTQ